MSGPPDEIKHAAEGDADIAAALKFRDEFSPQDSVEYGWVFTLAKEQYLYTLKVFDDLDAKAATVANYLASGTGVLTLGSLAAVASGQVNPWLVLLALPSAVAACVALGFALKCRRTMSVWPPPTTDGAVQYANGYATVSEAQGAFAAQYNLCDMLLRPVNRLKARLVNRATEWFFVAIALLALPISAGLYQKFNQPPPLVIPEAKL